jgi:hypothetical protein
MSFLHAGLVLFALPLALLPVLLHLLTLQRLRTVELSTFRFLFDSYVQQRRRMQFLEALLAFLRTLFLLVLILAVGRPVARHWDRLFAGGDSGREVILLVDCSASMNAVSRGETALKRAQAAAKTVLSRLATDDRVTLVRVTARPEEVFGRVSVDPGPQSDKIDNLKLSPTRANFFAALMAVFGSESRRPVKPHVYVFTDAQATGWKEVKNQGLDRVLPEGTPVTVVAVGDAKAANLAVIGDPPRRQRAVVGLPVVLSARVVNHGPEPAEATLSFLVNDKEVRRVNLTLKPGETATRREVYEPAEPGTPRGRFDLSPKSPDPFPDDDRYEFALAVAPRVPVVIVNGGPSDNPFDDAALYLRVALTTTGAAAGAKPGDKPAAGALQKTRELVRSLDVRVIPEGALNPEAIRDAGVVVLADCGQLNTTHFGWLRDFVSGGGGLLVLPGERVNAQVYNSQFFPAHGPQRETLTAVTLGEKFVGDPDNPDTFERLAEVDYNHPVLSVFDDREAQFFREVRVKRRWPLVPPKTRGNAFPLARFSDGSPALVESRLGDGAVVLAAFPADAKWTNFPSKCAREFVPLMLRLVSHVQRRPEVDAPLVVPPEGVAEFTVAGSWAPVRGAITAPGGGSTDLAFERSGGRYVAAFEGTGERGFYTAEVAGARGDQRRGDLAFAVNLAAEESDPTAVGETQLQELLPGAEVTLVDASAEEVQKFGSVGSEQELWRPLIYLLFFVIGAEFLLATLGGSRRGAAGDEGRPVSDKVASYNPGSLVSRMTGGK